MYYSYFFFLVKLLISLELSLFIYLNLPVLLLVFFFSYVFTTVHLQIIHWLYKSPSSCRHLTQSVNFTFISQPSHLLHLSEFLNCSHNPGDSLFHSLDHNWFFNLFLLVSLWFIHREAEITKMSKATQKKEVFILNVSKEVFILNVSPSSSFE